MLNENFHTFLVRNYASTLSSRKRNLFIKSWVLENMPELVISFKKNQKAINFYHYCRKHNKDFKSDISYSDAVDYIDNMIDEFPDVYTILKNISSADYQRLKRLSLCIKKMFRKANKNNLKVRFLTFTISPEALEKYKLSYFRKSVCDYLSKNYEEYIANIDYGKENERVHFHALVLENHKVDKEIFLKFTNKFGYVKNKPVKTDLEDRRRLSKYILKLTNHAVKNTTKQNRVIYCRNYQKKELRNYLRHT